MLMLPGKLNVAPPTARIKIALRQSGSWLGEVDMVFNNRTDAHIRNHTIQQDAYTAKYRIGNGAAERLKFRDKGTTPSRQRRSGRQTANKCVTASTPAFSL